PLGGAPEHPEASEKDLGELVLRHAVVQLLIFPTHVCLWLIPSNVLRTKPLCPTIMAEERRNWKRECILIRAKFSTLPLPQRFEVAFGAREFFQLILIVCQCSRLVPPSPRLFNVSQSAGVTGQGKWDRVRAREFVHDLQQNFSSFCRPVQRVERSRQVDVALELVRLLLAKDWPDF